MSKKQWLLGKHRFHCNGIWITDIFSRWFLKSVTVSDIHIFLHILLLIMAHDDKDIFWSTKKLLGFIFWVEYGYWQTVLWDSLVPVWGIRGVRSMDGHSVQMLAWNIKFWAQRVKVLYPTFHSISVWAHYSTPKSKWWQKKFWSTLWWPLRLTVMFTWKAESFRVPCFFMSC